MKNVIYNPLRNKHPIGALKNNENMKIDLYIRNEISVKDLNFVIFYDKTEHNHLKYRMIFQEFINGHSLYTIELPTFDVGLYFYYFEFKENNSLKYIINNNFDAEINDYISTWQLTVYDKNFKTPEWVKGGIMYQIFPDRFEKDINFIPKQPRNIEERRIHSEWGDIPNSPLDTYNYSAKDFFMGNLNGILNKKEYIKSLNVDMIYLNPIFESSENHRYSTADYFNIDPYLGNNEIFKKFCKEFQKIDIEIILDGVFSHTGSDSIYFNKYNRYSELGSFNSTESKYYSWFKFTNYPYNYESWWGFDNLPTLHKENKEYINFICQPEIGVLNYWQNMGIKGWRIDVLDEFPDIFVDELRKSVKTKDRDCFIIGEVWEDATTKFSYGNRRRYLQGRQVDSVMNYPWKNSIIKFLKTSDTIAFSKEIMSLVNNYPAPALDTLMNLLSTHDTERIITVLGTDISKIKYEDSKNFQLSTKEYEQGKFLQKFASFLQFTLPGIPSIYYGDEIGMQGLKDPFNRACFDLEKADNELLKHYTELSSFRSKFKDNFKSGFKFDYISDKVISYYRNNILCIINMSSKPVIFEHILQGEWIFGNKKVFFTDYGAVIAAKSYNAIKRG
ncbi:MAG: glycoside hydrolase family 13 protein [Fusobacterium sp.]|uniref:glycoside hydrolase family 13 protein n=1 Tax=Fusobacterium sp. TaxID=68766 RepID=UPI0026DBCA0D|nr:glycoside hydrolase family 13 protein [Fusobacterium sp.]MDO4691030.1 glycoside hydrolase family 13 protein [Fusobacterium sp.]